jgi:hypothetical protein
MLKRGMKRKRYKYRTAVTPAGRPDVAGQPARTETVSPIISPRIVSEPAADYWYGLDVIDPQ